MEWDTETTQGERERAVCAGHCDLSKAMAHGANSDRLVRTHGVWLSYDFEISRLMKRVVERMKEIWKQKPRARHCQIGNGWCFFWF